MQGVLFAPLAIFLHLESIRIILLVLFGRVVAALALGAGQGDQRTHELSFKKKSKFSLNLYTYNKALS